MVTTKVPKETTQVHSSIPYAIQPAMAQGGTQKVPSTAHSDPKEKAVKTKSS